jgi:hypothetical protein
VAEVARSNRHRAKWGTATVDILVVLGVLLVTLFFVTFSCARSYFEKGRLRGMEEAVRELAQGIKSHFENNGQPPDRVVTAFEEVKAVACNSRRLSKGSTQRYHAQLWILGDAIGEACWFRGHGAGVRRKAPAEGKFRVDLSLNELLHLSWLAHLGFQRMMPNYRDIEVHRFSGEEDANEGAIAVSKIEAAIPAKDRPFADLSVQFTRRNALISDWWQVTQHRSLA